ncbi:MAG: dihydroxyacetone kinase subunit DhaL [Actinomycetota bacterium]|nr:dihydroxyacetone kinase subunit DhaL [Actinomycetota bacterium]
MATQKENLIGIIQAISNKLIDAEKMLTELDSSVGDADCGIGVKRGFTAVKDSLDQLYSMELGDILKKVGFTLAYTIGGTSGAMLGTGFLEAGKSIADRTEIGSQDLADALEAANTVIKRRGGNTQVGDKTLIDALEPAVESIKSSAARKDAGMVQIIEQAYQAAKQGSDSTIDLIAKKGRASYLGERSKGHRDPGSVVIYLIFEAALEYLKSTGQG